MNSKYYLLGLVLLCVPAFGAKKAFKVSQPTVKFAGGSAKKLVIEAVAGSVVLRPNKKSKDIAIRATKSIAESAGSLDDLRQLVVTKGFEGDTFNIKGLLPQSKSQWAQWARGGDQIPKLSLDIVAPPTVPVEVFLKSGNVSVRNWNANVTVVSQKGNIVVDKVKGSVVVRSQEGKVVVKEVAKNLGVDNFKSKLVLSNVVGKLTLKTFTGGAKVSKVKGGLVVSAQKAIVAVSQTAGAAHLKLGEGSIKLRGHKGSVSGSSGSGGIYARLQGSSPQVSLSSDGGSLQVNVPRGSGARVSMSSRGYLKGPSSLYKGKSGELKSLRGSIGGGGGRIQLNSQSGTVALKLQ